MAPLVLTCRIKPKVCFYQRARSSSLVSQEKAAEAGKKHFGMLAEENAFVSSEESLSEKMRCISLAFSLRFVLVVVAHVKQKEAELNALPWDLAHENYQTRSQRGVGFIQFAYNILQGQKRQSMNRHWLSFSFSLLSG